MQEWSPALCWINYGLRQIGIFEDGYYAFCMKDGIKERKIVVTAGEVEGMNRDRKLQVRLLKIGQPELNCFAYRITSESATIHVPLEVEQGEVGFRLKELRRKEYGNKGQYSLNNVKIIDSV